MNSTLDLETGLRGFLLAGNPTYLEPYYRGRDTVIDIRPRHPEVLAWAAPGVPDAKFGDIQTARGNLMQDAIATDGPVVVDVRVTREENTYPMIAPGQAARDMVG